jgi:phage terminase small subunit
VLDERKRRFCELYLLTFNGAKAYREAGYTCSTDATAWVGASKLLRSGKVQSYLAELRSKVQVQTGVTLADVVLELRRILTTDILDALNDDGTFKPVKDWPVDLRRAVASIEVDELFEGAGEERTQVGWTRKVKLWSKTDGAQQLMRHLGGFELDNKQKEKSYLELLMGSMEGEQE